MLSIAVFNCSSARLRSEMSKLMVPNPVTLPAAEKTGKRVLTTDRVIPSG